MGRKMKRLKISIAFTAFLCFFVTTLMSCGIAEYYGSTFSEVWGKVTSDPYSELPHAQVTVPSFFKAGLNMLFLSSFRTVNDKNDLKPPFDKLLHPNGVCLSGTWNITEENPYTGYFANGSSALIIVRASVALSDTERGNYRGFGFSGKLYPTTDPNHTDALKTANFFAIDNVSGTLADHYLDVAMTNQPLVASPATPDILDIGAIATATLGLADINPGIRQLYEISELGLSDPSTAITPGWIKIQATPGQIRVDEADFRNELNLSNYEGGQLSFDIYVTTQKSTASTKTWEYIGYILLDDYAASGSCDHCLHFHHPKYKAITTG